MKTTAASKTLAEQAASYLDAIVAHTGGQARTGQQQMCEQIADAVASDGHALAQAPTGTGKSFAYLAVAVAEVQRQRTGGGREPVVVVTATKALQEQLIAEDLPTVAAALGASGVKFSFELLKGRSNYLCRARHNEHSSGAETLFDASGRGEAQRVAADLERIDEWVGVTVRGDRSELEPLVSDEAWRAVSIGSECPGKQRCSYGTDCFAETARTVARRSDIIVTNAALYAADLAADGVLLGDHHVVIIDEAQSFDAAVTDAFTATFAAASVRTAMQNARRAGADHGLCDRLGDAADVAESMVAAVALDGGEQLIFPDRDWIEVFATLSDTASAVAVSLDKAGGDTAEKDRALQAGAAIAKISEAAVRVASPNDGNATWVREDRRGRRELVVAPINVAPMLAGQLWSKRSVIATSATLKYGGSLDGYARRAGTNGGSKPWVAVDVESPFDFKDSAMLFVAKHLPDPRQDAFAPAAQKLTAELIVAAGGRTLALFTSHRALRDAADALTGELARAGIEVLCQGDDSRDTLVTRLRDSAESGGVAVFATQSFWTGVDIAGAGLSLVVIDKLPFARPNDPLSVARRAEIEARGGNAFGELDVPRAGGLLAQGAGRLIRSVHDRGVVAVMDRRLAVAGYRNQLLGGLPPFKRSVSVADTCAFLAQLRSAAEGSDTAVAA